MPKILIVAYYFPPCQASGVFRTLGFVQYLEQLGWDITVLTVDSKLESRCSNLMKELPQSVQIARAKEIDFFLFWDWIKKRYNHAPSSSKNCDNKGCNDAPKLSFLRFFKDQITAILKTPDSQAGWFFPAMKLAFSLERPDVIYSSAPPFTGHLIGASLKTRWKVPLVVDYRDPWGGNPFRCSCGGIAEKWDRVLERWVVESADHIVLNTKQMKEMFASYFPQPANKTTVITNGFDPGRFKNISGTRQVSQDRLLFVHPGFLYGQRNPLPFLKAVRKAIYERGMAKILVQLIGLHEPFEGKSLADHIIDMGLSNYVFLVQSLPHNKCLSVMKGADVLLLLALGTTLQVPAKLFEYLGIGNPIFAICEENSATMDIMKSLSGRHFVVINNENEIVNKIAELYSIWTSGDLKENSNKRHEDWRDQFHRHALTKKLHDILIHQIALD